MKERGEIGQRMVEKIERGGKRKKKRVEGLEGAGK